MKKLLILSAIASFGDAALFYSYYLGINTHNYYWSVVYMHVTSMAPKKLLFARSVNFMGALNFLFFFSVFGIFSAILKDFARSRG